MTFNLEIPLDRRVREATLNQIGTSAHGTTVTLDRIVVTPSETKVYLRAFARSGGSGGTSVAPILHVAGKEIDAESTVGEEGEIVATYDAALYDDHSTWSLKVLTDPVMTDNSRSYGGIVTFALSMA